MIEAKKSKMPIFAARFSELRGERTQAEFAEFLGISRPTVGFYENGERIPDALVLRQIAEKCGVTTDFLVGLSDNKVPENYDIGKRTGLVDVAIDALGDMTDPESGLYNSGHAFIINSLLISQEFRYMLYYLLESAMVGEAEPIDTVTVLEGEFDSEGEYALLPRKELKDYYQHRSAVAYQEFMSRIYEELGPDYAYGGWDHPIRAKIRAIEEAKEEEREGANHADNPETR